MQSHVGLLVAILLIVLVAGVTVLTSMHRKLKRMQHTVEPRIGDVGTLYDDDNSVGSKKKIVKPEHTQQKNVDTWDFAPSEYDSREQVVDFQTVADEVSSIEIDDAIEIDDPITNAVIVINVVAKDNKQFAGYELLQALLSAGMRFGEMKIFHRHKESNGQGPILFSLASITEPGTFDIHNMGAFIGSGLSFFMQLSGSPTIDSDRFDLMLDTAKQLTEDLDGRLLDDRYQPFSEKRLMTYLHCIRQNTQAMAEA